MIAAIFIPAGPIDQPSFTYSVRPEWSLETLHEALNCELFDVVNLGKNQMMYVDDLGRQKGLTFNAVATTLYHRLRGGDMIVGNVVVLGCTPDGETCSVSSDILHLTASMAAILADPKLGGFSEIA